MPDIGETLRETRMRRRIDMSEVEASTKIRAKYLRALENEEWDLLPGPTFVKSFLRTYAEFLDLDPRLLVEEYRQRYERPSGQELTPFRPPRGGQGRGTQGRRRQSRRRRSRLPIVPVLGVGAVILALLLLVGIIGPWLDHGGSGPTVATTATPTPTVVAGTGTPTATPTPAKHKPPAAPTRVKLRLSATKLVYVCLVDAKGKVLINGQQLQPGQATKTYTSASFRANFGNDGVTMRIGSHRYPASGSPVGYQFRPGKAPRKLAESVRVKLCA
jgi:cytoskeleton protein RodZ